MAPSSRGSRHRARQDRGSWAQGYPSWASPSPRHPRAQSLQAQTHPRATPASAMASVAPGISNGASCGLGHGRGRADSPACAATADSTPSKTLHIHRLDVRGRFATLGCGRCDDLRVIRDEVRVLTDDHGDGLECLGHGGIAGGGLGEEGSSSRGLRMATADSRTTSTRRQMSTSWSPTSPPWEGGTARGQTRRAR